LAQSISGYLKPPEPTLENKTSQQIDSSVGNMEETFEKRICVWKLENARLSINLENILDMYGSFNSS
jgi:hypothetical protein